MKIQINELPAIEPTTESNGTALGPPTPNSELRTSGLPTSPEGPWESLFRHTVEIASRKINRRRWRGAFGGVLPDGYDANAIAAEAVAELIKDRRKRSLPELPVLHSFSGGGCTPDSTFCTLHSALCTDLERRVSRHVDRLRHRKENSLFRNEPDLAPILDFDGELVSVVETLPAPDPNPFQALLRKEDDAEVRAFRDFLGKERRLKTLLDCLASGITKPRELARELRISVPAVKNLRKRLNRRYEEYVKYQGSAQNLAVPKKAPLYAAAI